MKAGIKPAGRIKTPRVPTPRANPMGRQRPPLGLPHVAVPRVKKQTRDYQKIKPINDPAADASGMGVGFGATGMTGES